MARNREIQIANSFTRLKEFPFVQKMQAYKEDSSFSFRLHACISCNEQITKLLFWKSYYKLLLTSSRAGVGFFQVG